MKKWIIGIILIIGILIVGTYEHTYKLKECKVIDTSNYNAMIQDNRGHIWEVHNIDLDIGQKVELYMYNNRTKNIKDDIVKEVIIND